ncbi:TU92-like protein [Mya arenaria]|uniref:TU92-like protein n=1 Tax=Mya arenaria TaxID=6604 RepID=A0ABY7ET29_MYAAR|nr:turripeptide Gsg9.2-like [Mya arenaria]XP_052819024.1 turripeptide Gsg9.2-like [Mya arenaria]WAR12332.1 TU92-like protein [Mya arenaria]
MDMKMCFLLFVVYTGCWTLEHSPQQPRAWNLNRDPQDQRPAFLEQDAESSVGHGHLPTDVYGCPEACTMELRSVCGSDGQTYDNLCLLNVAACKMRRRLFVEKNGRC